MGAKHVIRNEQMSSPVDVSKSEKMELQPAPVPAFCSSLRLPAVLAPLMSPAMLFSAFSVPSPEQDTVWGQPQRRTISSKR